VEPLGVPIDLARRLRLDTPDLGVQVMRNLGIVALCVTLGGCASVNYILQEYQGVPVQEIRMSDDTYRIFD
jgi:hypothetical protein